MRRHIFLTNACLWGFGIGCWYILRVFSKSFINPFLTNNAWQLWLTLIYILLFMYGLWLASSDLVLKVKEPPVYLRFTILGFLFQYVVLYFPFVLVVVHLHCIMQKPRNKVFD